jgi:MFS family permease
MLVPLNSTMIAVALPRLVEAFDPSLGSVSWLVTSYLMAMASLQPMAGKLEDRMGAGRSCSVGSPGSPPHRRPPPRRPAPRYSSPSVSSRRSPAR